MSKMLIGRNEWCRLPGLKIPAIKAKIDTGARTSAIHAFDITPYVFRGKKYVSFAVHPLQGNDKVTALCKALIQDERAITSSNGHREHRYIISTIVLIGTERWEIEVSLSNRDPLRYRLLLGREALANHVVIDPSLSCMQGSISKKILRTLYSSH